MKKVKEKLRHLPRSTKVALNLFGVVLILLSFYISVGCPAFTPEQQFRREEKANMVGPATILDTIALEKYTDYYSFDRLLLAISQDGVTLFCYKNDKLAWNDFIYREKRGGVTILSIPNRFGATSYAKYRNVDIPVIVVDSFPKAVRAELQMELYSIDTNRPFRKEYTLYSNRSKNGYFLFILSANNPDGLGTEGNVIERFLYLFDETYNTGLTIPATVRLFDNADNLVSEVTVEISD